MDDRKRKKLPGSRKALEYRVYWLERKLSFLRCNEKRDVNAARIERLPASPIKELMHLNNEFQRSNEQAHALKNLTEELNQDALRINERSERIHEVSLGKITDAERLNRQSRRLHDRTRKINKNSMQTTAEMREANKQSKETTSASQLLIDEAKYLSTLTRAQHIATDNLNRKTRGLNLDAIKTTVTGLKLNRQLDDTCHESDELNQKTQRLQNELNQVKAELAIMNTESLEIQQASKEKLQRLGKIETTSLKVLERAEVSSNQADTQFEQGEELFNRTAQLNAYTENNLQRFGEFENKADKALHQSDEQNNSLRAQLSGDVAQFQENTLRHLTQFNDQQNQLVRTELEQTNLQLNHESHLLAHDMKLQQQELSENIGASMNESRTQLKVELKAAKQQLTSSLELSENLNEELVETSKQDISELIEQNSRLAVDAVDNFEIKSRGLLENQERLIQQHEIDSDKQLSDVKSKADALLTAQEQNNQQLISGYESRTKDKLKDFHNSSTLTVAEFIARSTTSLDKAENTIDRLSQQINSNLQQSQDFLDNTASLNHESNRIVSDTTELNATSLELHHHCGEAINEIDEALKELSTLGDRLQRQSEELKRETIFLNDDSRQIQETTSDINTRSLSIQHESVKTQELSQEINHHSLALHEETRSINQKFSELNLHNENLASQLLELKQTLTTQHQSNQQQIVSTHEVVEVANQINSESKSHNTESKLLNEKTLETLNRAKLVIKETEQSNDTARDLSETINNAFQKLKSLQEEIEHAGQDSRETTAEARESILNAQQLHDRLTRSATEIQSLQRNASVEMVSLQSLKDEAADNVTKFNESREQLHLCIAESRQINDDFMRGLEATTTAHKETETKAKSLLSESEYLQSEIKQMLSLKTGFREFQENIEQCQVRLDQYADQLDGCQQNSRAHSELLNDYQARIEHYHGDIQKYRESVTQFESRARRLESYFTDQEMRIKDLETTQPEDYEDRINNHVEKMRILESEVRAELKVKHNKLDDNLNSLRDSLDTSVEELKTELMHRLTLEMDKRDDRTNEKIDATRVTVKKLNLDFEELNRSIFSEIATLRDESQELRNQNLDFQHQGHSSRQETKKKLTGYKSELDDVKHKLKNYSDLLQHQMDNEQSSEWHERISSLETNIKLQQRALDSQESFKTEVKEKLEDSSQLDDLTSLVKKLEHSMDESQENNRLLKTSIMDSEKTNRELLVTNNRLQRQVQSTQQEKDSTLQEFSNRMNHLEDREREFQQTIKSLRSRESDTNQTLQQMRLAMKDSTKAMRDTQKTLEKFKSDEKNGRSWVESSRQAAMTSVIAVLFTGLAMFGYEKVDASVNEVGLADVNQPYISPRFISQTSRLPLPSVVQTDKSLQSLSHANTSINTHGEFAWPVNFGIVDPSTIKYQPHRRGISISAELGDPVVAVNNGTVIYSANEIRGYGNVIVIQHDENLVSVYANNQFNYVKQGDKVKRGQLIGDIGQLFNLDEAGLYFEIRYMGTPEDPFNYLSQTTQANIMDFVGQG